MSASAVLLRVVAAVAVILFLIGITWVSRKMSAWETRTDPRSVARADQQSFEDAKRFHGDTYGATPESSASVTQPPPNPPPDRR